MLIKKCTESLFKNQFDFEFLTIKILILKIKLYTKSKLNDIVCMMYD